MIYVILGPTGIGKTLLSVELAKKINAVIVNADPYQMYKELNVGTAKPTLEELNGVENYLYNCCSISEEINIYYFQKIFRDCLKKLLLKNKNIIVVSGSGLYLKSALYDYEFVNIKVNNKDEYEKLSNEELYYLLKQKDKYSADKFHINNRKRIIQTLIINDNLNEGFTKQDFENKQKHIPIYKDIIFIGLNIEREKLYNQINLRVDEMFNNGLKNEVDKLFLNYDKNNKAFQAIGYKEFLNDLSVNQTKELIKKNSRNYAKRQLTFFKNQFNDVNWYNSKEDALNFALSKFKNGK